MPAPEKVDLRESEEVFYPPVVKDELNCVNLPITSCSQKSIMHPIEKKWEVNGIEYTCTVTGSMEHGIPPYHCEELRLALNYLAWKDGFSSPTIFCKPYEILKILDWGAKRKRKSGAVVFNPGGCHYDKLILAFKQLLGVHTFTDATRIRTSDSRTNTICIPGGYHIITSFRFAIMEDPTAVFLEHSFSLDMKVDCFTFDDFYFSSLVSGYTRDLDNNHFKSLKKITAKKLYQYAGTVLWKQNHYCINLERLCYIHMNISTARPDLLKQRLQKGIDELNRLGLYKIEIKPGKEYKWVVHFYKLNKKGITQ